ncbi:hypothetical protein [Nostoc sp. 'Peltigera membranacea cyanobiont' 232]|uniref:hypothetical protein n=1 Tax=Nostoc sp. 'Peltigera membranacea cyanobiont' 232 TaxID=2014531 RepID=UPI000B958C83|nr:hypothetical protein [Nostoc sp. 'Peltigera membranacea cyanobiont' 232]OYE06176.1 hypothetical protein CDG79_03330 [Nostoc sp. 'Peltigera membranacea cyanobiont' 232]
MPSIINLTSRGIRSAAVPNGRRVISSAASGEGGFFGFLTTVAQSLLKDLFSKISQAITWTFTSIWTAIVVATSFIVNFNFNITDTEIQAQIDNSFLTIAGLLGQAAGKTLGYLACGALPTLGILVISPEVFEAIAPKITEELLEQLATEYSTIIYQSSRLLLNAGFLWLYGSIRRAFRGSDDDLKNRLKAAGANEDKIKKELEARSKPFILSQKIQENIDSIQGKKTKAFVDQAYQEFGMACTEAGYVVAGALDSYIYQKKLVTVVMGNSSGRIF